MSERKTAEIKIRLTPTEKVWWQEAAGERGLSEWLRELANHAVQNKAGTPVIPIRDDEHPSLTPEEQANLRAVFGPKVEAPPSDGDGDGKREAFSDTARAMRPYDKNWRPWENGAYERSVTR